MMDDKPYNGDVRLEARVSVIEKVLKERKKVLKLTAKGLEKRLKLLSKLGGVVMTKDEYTLAHEILANRLSHVENMQSKMIGIGITLIALSGLLGVYLGHLIK